MNQGRGAGKDVLATAALALALIGAGAAQAAPGDTVLRGETAEGVRVKLTVGSAGNATRFKVAKTKVGCERGGTLDNGAGVYRDFDRSDPGEFSDRRSGSSGSGGYRFKTRSSIEGAVASGGHTWTGTFKLTNKVFEDGRRIDVCRLKTTWSAGA